MRRPGWVKLVVAIQLLIGVAIIVYWLIWLVAPELLRARAPGDADYAVYVAFEGAFLLADGWIAAAALTGAAGLWQMRDWGLLFTLLASGAGIFLGLVDLLYDLEHGMYAPLTGAAALELLIVAGLLILCPVSVYLAWQGRRALRARASTRSGGKPAPRRRRRTATSRVRP